MLNALESGSFETRKVMTEELTRMARIADAYVEKKTLISAAPDLLEACREAIETIQGQAELLRQCGAAYGIGKTLQTLETAIVKAGRGTV